MQIHCAMPKSAQLTHFSNKVNKGRRAREENERGILLSQSKVATQSCWQSRVAYGEWKCWMSGDPSHHSTMTKLTLSAGQLLFIPSLYLFCHFSHNHNTHTRQRQCSIPQTWWDPAQIQLNSHLLSYKQFSKGKSWRGIRHFGDLTCCKKDSMNY